MNYIQKTLFSTLTLCAMYILYKKYTSSGSGVEVVDVKGIVEDIKSVVEDGKSVSIRNCHGSGDEFSLGNNSIIDPIQFDYTCCEPVYTSIELSNLLNCEKRVMNFYDLIWSINNYLYEFNLLEFQFVTLNDKLQKILNTDKVTIPYHSFIEQILNNHVDKFI